MKNAVQLFSKSASQKELLMASIYQVLPFHDCLRNSLKRGVKKETLKETLTGIKRQLYVCKMFKGTLLKMLLHVVELARNFN